MKRPWLLPLNPLWALATSLKNEAYDHHRLPIRRLQKPVISIGSLSAGGAGKTPVVIALTQLLARHGIAADVLSRGYGRGSGAIEQVDPNGPPECFGDEPLEIAESPISIRVAHPSRSEGWGIEPTARPPSPHPHNLPMPHSSQSDEWVLSENHGSVIPSEARSAQSRNPRIPSPRPTAPSTGSIPVFVGANRHAAGQLAESTLPHTALHLLDDAFQHRQLARSLDLVLLTVADTRDTLLPAGNLREPLRSLRRAHAILLREEEAAALAPIARRHAPHVQQWLIRRTLMLPASPPQQALAFCGLARPQSFFAQLRTAGCTLAATLPFPDHHPYTSEDMSALLLAARRTRATAFLTTAKDAVKLPPVFRQRLEAIAPLHIARLTVHFLDEPAVLATLPNPGAP